MPNWMSNAWNWTSNLLGMSDAEMLREGAQFAMSYFDDDGDSPGDFSASATNLSGKIKTSITTPRSATAGKISKSPITSQAEATVNKHRAMLARAISISSNITAKSKRT